MKIITKLLTACSAGLALTTASFALTWTSENTDNVYLSANPHSGSSSTSGTFNIKTAGYNPATMVVTSAIASFQFCDPEGDSSYWWEWYIPEEWGRINMDGGTFISNFEIDSTTYSAGLAGTILANLQDGIIGYTVQITQGDIWLTDAKLVANGGTKSIPDSGASLGLFALGLAALILSRKRLC